MTRLLFGLALVLFLVPAAGAAGTDPSRGAEVGPPDPDLFLRRARAAPSIPASLASPHAKSAADGDSILAALAALVDPDSLRRTVADLVAFGTRYEYAAEQESAADYLLERFEALGYEPFEDVYSLSPWDVFDAAFPDGGDDGWIVASNGDTGVVLAAREGGAALSVATRIERALYSVSAPAEDAAWAVGDKGIVLRFDGHTWSPADTLGVDPLPSVDFIDRMNGMVLSRIGIVYRTSDGGATWDADTLTTSFLADLEYVDSTHAWAAGSNGTMFAWSPAGWEYQATGSFRTIRDLAFHDASFGIAALSEATALVWEGFGWRTVATGVASGYTVGAVSDSAVWLAGLDGLFLTRVVRSDDRGSTWTETRFPYGVLWRSVNAMHFDREGRTLFGGYDGFLVASEDGGASWRPIALPDSIAHLSRNVGADLPGCGDPDSVVILSAHYDSYSIAAPYTDAPGADDDATGVAAVLEGARLLSGARVEKTLRFLLFSGEELGLYGSTAYAIAARERGEKIAADLQIDMIGIPGEPLQVYADWPSSWILDEASFVRSVVAPDLPFQGNISPQSTFSDHASFWANGYEAIQISETIGDVGGENPFHTPGDTLGNIDFAFCADAARLAISLAARLAGTRTLDPAETRPIVWRPYPNPSRGVLAIPLAGSSDGARVEVFDLAGRLVRRLVGGAGERCAPCEIEWDGRDDGGREAASGTYLLRMTADAERWTRKIILVR